MLHDSERLATRTGDLPADASRNLDFLRSAAVLSVFAGHFLLNVVGFDHLGSFDVAEAARAGVYLFFVHTCLVLLLSLERAWPREGAGAFLLRRVFRIYPLSIVCVVAVYLFEVPWEPRIPYEPISPRRLWANLLLVQNLFPSLKEVISPLWSLPWEMQMYLSLPAIFAICRRRRAMTTLLAIWLISAVVGGARWGDGSLRALRIVQYVPCFLGGAVAFVLMRRPGTRRVIPAVAWPLVTVGSIFAYAVLHGRIPAAYAMQLKYVYCLGLGATFPFVLELGRSWLTAVARLIARYSYGIYLSHFPLMWLCFTVLDLSQILRWVVFIPLAIGVPVVAYHWIEKPANDYGHRIVKGFARTDTTSQPA